MGTSTGTLALPGFGRRIAAKPIVEYESTAEGALVRRAQNGDEGAFREIVERYQSKVFSIIHGIVRQRNDVEDIAQQVFAKVYLSLKSFDFRSSLITWIYKITVNECFDYLRKRKVRKLVYESDLSEDEVRRVENSEPQANRPVAGGHRPGAPRFRRQAPRQSLRRRAYVIDDEGSRGLLRGGVVGPNRDEREHHQGETVPRPPEAGAGGAAAGSVSRNGGWVDGSVARLRLWRTGWVPPEAGGPDMAKDSQGIGF